MLKEDGMRLIDADELMEHVYRDKLDSRELIAQMIENAPTVRDDAETIKKNLMDALEYEKKLNKEILGRLDAHRDIIKLMTGMLIEKAIRS